MATLSAIYSPARAGEVDVLAVAISETSAGVYRFDVTLGHADEGWEHYADAWEVLGPDGAVLARRVLLHPHVDEQPFTRGLGGVALPAGLGRVTLRGHDSVHGYGGIELTVELPK